MKKNRFHIFTVLLLSGLLSLTGNVHAGNYLSPSRTVAVPGEEKIWVVLSTAPALLLLDLATEQPERRIDLDFQPSDMTVSPDGKTLYVTEYGTPGKLHAIQADNGKIKHSITVGDYPSAVCINRKGDKIWTANRFSNDISVVNPNKKTETARIPAVREPVALALSPSEETLAVANLLPFQSSLDRYISARITLIDARNDQVVENIALANGSQSIEGLCFSPDGNYLYATHVLSRFMFPTTQIERGWINTNALSIIDMQDKRYYNTLLLDQVDKGAANPRSATVSADGKRLYIALSGTHELMSIDLPGMHEKLELLKTGKLPDALTSFEELPDNLSFIHTEQKRIPLRGKGPRHVAEYNGQIYLSDYFSGGLDVIDPDKAENSRFIGLGEEPEPDAARKGELYFNDAAFCLQHWQSCISCHPDVRTDALNWDLMNDGLGNPKNTKSLVLAHVTPPCMITGIRKNAEIAVRAGIKWIQFAERSEEEAACIDAYLKSQTPLPSPHLQQGKPTAAAEKGKQVFEKAGCAECHNGPHFTDQNKYDVGTGEGEYTGTAFDTPGLREIWRTYPYLYDGRAKTLREVLTTFNPEDRHGKTSNLTEEEIDELTEYLLSL